MKNRFFTINRKDRARPFLFQAMLGAINLLVFFALVVILIVYRNNLLSGPTYILFAIYGFYLLTYFFVTTIFFAVLKKALTKGERNYFASSLFWALFGINFFMALNFYFKSGLSSRQKSEAIKMIQQKHIEEIASALLARNKLSAQSAKELQTLLAIARNKHEDWANMSFFILNWLEAKNLPVELKIADSEIIEQGKYL